MGSDEMLKEKRVGSRERASAVEGRFALFVLGPTPELLTGVLSTLYHSL
jgi:hypothetical protein